MVLGPEKKIGHNSAPSGSQETKTKFDILIFDEDGRMQNLQAWKPQESRKRTFQKIFCHPKKVRPRKSSPGRKKNKIGHNSAPSGSQETKTKFDILIFDEDGPMKNLQAWKPQESRKPTFQKIPENFQK